MAVAFTSLADWEHAQDRTAAQEIILAYSERRQCIGDSAITAIAAGDVKQTTTFWLGVQDWIETNCVKWVDDTNFSTSTAYSDIADIAYTFATFCTEAGFNTDGFRRATEWPTDWTDPADAAYSFGKITAGDIVGPWIFEDLQAAFDAMRWTFTAVKFNYSYVTYDYELEYLGGATNIDCAISSAILYAGNANDTSGASPPDWENMYDEAVLDWTDYSGSTDATPYVYGIKETFDYNSSGFQTCHISFRSRELGFSDIPTHLNHSANAYFFIEGNDTFEDFQSLGLADSKFFEKQSFVSASSSTRSVDKYATATTPYYKAPTVTVGNLIDYGAKSEGMCLFMKWSFTNTL